MGAVGHHTYIHRHSPPKGLNYRQTVAITVQSKSVTLTPYWEFEKCHYKAAYCLTVCTVLSDHSYCKKGSLGIPISVDVSNKLIIVSMQPLYCICNTVYLILLGPWMQGMVNYFCYRMCLYGLQLLIDKTSGTTLRTCEKIRRSRAKLYHTHYTGSVVWTKPAL